jgi:hypothetical protein
VPREARARSRTGMGFFKRLDPWLPVAVPAYAVVWFTHVVSVCLPRPAGTGVRFLPVDLRVRAQGRGPLCPGAAARARPRGALPEPAQDGPRSLRLGGLRGGARSCTRGHSRVVGPEAQHQRSQILFNDAREVRGARLRGMAPGLVRRKGPGQRARAGHRTSPARSRGLRSAIAGGSP